MRTIPKTFVLYTFSTSLAVKSATLANPPEIPALFISTSTRPSLFEIVSKAC